MQFLTADTNTAQSLAVATDAAVTGRVTAIPAAAGSAAGSVPAISAAAGSAAGSVPAISEIVVLVPSILQQRVLLQAAATALLSSRTKYLSDAQPVQTEEQPQRRASLLPVF